MFDDLSPAERRKILLASRIHFGTEFTVPRRNAMDGMIKNALFVADAGEWLTAGDVLHALREIGNLSTLRSKEVEERLKALHEDSKLLRKTIGRNSAYRLTETEERNIKKTFDDSSALIDRIVTRLFKFSTHGADPLALRSYFLAITCEVFSSLGSQAAGYITGQPINQFMNLERLEKIVDSYLNAFKISSSCRKDVRRKTLQFFQENDPEYNEVKFSLGQSLYVAHLLGMDGQDFLCDQAFKNSTIFLDSNVAIPAVLSESRHFKIFQELMLVCNRLNIAVYVCRPTIDEVRRVAAAQEQVAPATYNQVPEGLVSKVRGDFFETFQANKALNPDFRVEEVFEPFEELSRTLQGMGVKVLDSEAFEEIRNSSELILTENILSAAWQELGRKRVKTKSALVHDATLFKFLKLTDFTRTENLYFVTTDMSIPLAWRKFSVGQSQTKCLLLDGLLQSISPFVVQTDGVGKFAELFSLAVSTQILPQGKIFDIEDFLLFSDLEIDCNEMDEDTVQEVLVRIKDHVSKGSAYNPQDREEAAYEMRRVLNRKRDKAEAWTKEREGLEKLTSDLEERIRTMTTEHNVEVGKIRSAHGNQVDALKGRIDALESKEQTRQEKRTKRLKRGKEAFAAVTFLVVFYLATIALIATAPTGSTILTLASFTSVYLLLAVLWLVMIKFLMFSEDPIETLFPTWLQIKKLFIG